ncbi:MAG: hypothetical protein HYX42_02920 [Polaromonas sp.]|uniref:hypothetical protein n=1 Tax=Polaromonas sp. TaxID=1869339 RepID=UPI0025F843DF|nr:hypothetical protein [Polaromonas sp.]MBI2725182.1 hypothetical protein [Polaromonas sp.]
MSTDLNAFVAIPLPTSLVTTLLRIHPHGISGLIEDVMADFLDRNKESLGIEQLPGGVYWEALFLPEKTQIRTTYFSEVKIATIENESIVWNGEIYASFAQLSNAMRGGKMTNAWRELQIKRPADKTWLPAQSLRR